MINGAYVSSATKLKCGLKSTVMVQSAKVQSSLSLRSKSKRVYHSSKSLKLTMNLLSENAGTPTTFKSLSSKRLVTKMSSFPILNFVANFSSKLGISLRKGAYSLRMTHSTATSVLHRHKTPRCQTQRTSIEERQFLGSKEQGAERQMGRLS